jgi:hypothetical protein
MRPIRIIIAVALIASVSIVSVHSTKVAPEASSVEWSRTYNDLQALSVIQTSDGGYAIVGAPLVSEAATFIKTDSSGNLQWQKKQGNPVSVVQTEDSEYALFYNNYVTMTNAEGDFQSSFSIELSGVRKGILTSDGNYVLVGNTRGDDGENFAWLYKVDRQGSILWNKKFTGGFTVYDVTETYDRGCALAGNWQNDFWLAKIDSNSNLQWSQTYSFGRPLDTHIVYSMAKTKDGGFVLAGAGEWQAGGGLVPWLIKINSQGHEQWNIPYGHIPHNSFNAVVQTNDEGYVVALGESAALVRTDSSGSELWKITIDNGGESSLNYSLPCLIRTTDGGYVIAGTTLGTTSFVTKISPEPDIQPPVVTVSSPKSKTYETGDISLMFTVNEPASWIGYSLNGQAEVTITGNTTLSGLSIGAHNLTVSAEDLTGQLGSSETIQFAIVARFPTELVIALLAVAAVVSVVFLVYFKRHSISANKKRGLTSFFTKKSLIAFANNRMVWTLTIISISILMVFVQIFFPYFYYSSSSRSSSLSFEVGISYVYEQDNIGQIYDEVSHIKDLGFSVIRVNMVCDSMDPSHYSNTLTDVFFSTIRQFNMKVAFIINNHDRLDDINYYLGKWGRDLTYVQVLNEPDIASSWDVGALFSDDEAGSKFEEICAIVEQHQLSAQLYTNFGLGFLVRTNLPVQFSEKLDFVGFDVFMESFLTLSPRMIQLLQKMTNKEIVIAEFGMSTSDDIAQCDFIIKGLNLFKSMGLRGCWLVYWNSVENNYGIRGRLAETTVGEWIAQNTKTS